MILAGNLLLALAQVLDIVINIYMWVIIIRSLISWVSPDPYNPIVQFLYRITEPVLSRARRYIPPLGGGLDLSPLVVILVLLFANRFLVQSLAEFGFQLKMGIH